MISLDESGGHLYLITVNAVNVVGSGVNTSGTCTPTILNYHQVK